MDFHWCWQGSITTATAKPGPHTGRLDLMVQLTGLARTAEGDDHHRLAITLLYVVLPCDCLAQLHILARHAHQATKIRGDDHDSPDSRPGRAESLAPVRPSATQRLSDVRLHDIPFGVDLNRPHATQETARSHETIQCTKWAQATEERLLPRPTFNRWRYDAVDGVKVINEFIVSDLRDARRTVHPMEEATTHIWIARKKALHPTVLYPHEGSWDQLKSFF
jgi:hypothetical protein